MKSILVIFVLVSALLCWGRPVIAQDVDPEPAPVPEEDAETPVPEEDTETPVPDDGAGEAEVEFQNDTQAGKAEKLAEASGVSVEEINAMRSGTRPEVPEGEGPEDPVADAPKGRGWGVIAKWLGLHPSEVGKGKKDVDVDDVDDDLDLPEPPELNEEASGIVDKASKREMKREEKRARKDLKNAKVAEKNNSARGKDKASEAAQRKNQKDRVRKDKPEKSSRGGKK